MTRYEVTFTSNDSSAGVTGEFDADSESHAIMLARERWSIQEGNPDFPLYKVRTL